MEMFSFFEVTPDLVCVAHREGYFKNVNRAVVDKLEYSKEELFARPIASFIHPDDRRITEQTRSEMLEGKALINFENRYLAKSGKVIWLQWTSFYVPDKQVVFAIAKDITVKKLIEKEINEKYDKFRQLADHFKRSIEKDRKYFAVELHEELAQLASVIKMDLDSVINKTDNLSEFSRTRITHASEISELLIQSIRKISFRLHPHMLDDLGLSETIKWLCNDFTLLTKIPCIFEHEYNEDHLSYEAKIDLFRVCQSSLNNIMNHANAHSVSVSIKESNDAIKLFIKDDGDGFDVSRPSQGSGLTAMGNRAASINAGLNIESKPGAGTLITLTISK